MTDTRKSTLACPPCGTQATAPAFCALDAGAYATRIAEIAELLRRFAGRAVATPDGVELQFAAQPGVLAVLDDLAAKERQCCATLRLSVTVQDSIVALRIAAAEGDRPALQRLEPRLT